MKNGLSRAQHVVLLAFVSLAAIFLLTSTGALDSLLNSAPGTGSGPTCGCTSISSCTITINPRGAGYAAAPAAEAELGDDPCAPYKEKCSQDDEDHVTQWLEDNKGNEVAGTRETLSAECNGTGVFSATTQEYWNSWTTFPRDHDFQTQVARPVCTQTEVEIEEGKTETFYEVTWESEPCDDNSLCETETDNKPTGDVTTTMKGCVPVNCIDGMGNYGHAAIVFGHGVKLDWQGNECNTYGSVATFVEKGICTEMTTDGVTYEVASLILTPSPASNRQCPNFCNLVRSFEPPIIRCR